MVIISYFAIITIHELGHLVCGLVTGYKFDRLEVMWFAWYKDEKSIKFQMIKRERKVAGRKVAGQCVMIPSQNYKYFKFFWYLFGGILFNLLTAFIALLLFITLEPSDISKLILIFIIIMNLVFSVNSLIPKDDNDGGLLLMGSRSDDNRRALHMMFFSNAIHGKLAKGMRLRDFPPEMFKITDDGAIENKHTARIVLLDAARLNDVGEYSLALKQLERVRRAILPLSCEECKVLKTITNITVMYHYATTSPCFEKAKSIYSDQSVQEFLAQDLLYNWQTLSAYHFFVLGDQTKGWELLNKAKAAAIGETNLGLRNMQIEELEVLEGLFRGLLQQSPIHS